MTKDEKRGLPREQRLELYLPHLAMGRGARVISKETGIPLGTVNTDLWTLRRSTEASIKDGTGDSQQTLQPPIHDDKAIDWQAKADQLGGAILQLFDTAVKQGKMNQANQWCNTFFRGLQAKFGSLRLTQINIDKQVVFNELPEDTKHRLTQDICRGIIQESRERGRTHCPLCKQKMPIVADIDGEDNPSCTTNGGDKADWYPENNEGDGVTMEPMDSNGANGANGTNKTGSEDHENHEDNDEPTEDQIKELQDRERLMRGVKIDDNDNQGE